MNSEPLNPGMKWSANRGKSRLFFVASVCFLILVFAMRARLELYGQGFNNQVHPCSSSKLYVDAAESRVLPPLTVAIWFAAALAYVLLFRGELVAARVFRSLVAHDVTLLYQRRFFRPPPISSSL